MFGQPACDGLLDQVPELVELSVGLVAHLERVTAIDKDRRAIAQHDRRPRRAGETRQPGQPFRIRRQELVLMRIRMGHHEPVEAGLIEACAQSAQTVCEIWFAHDREATRRPGARQLRATALSSPASAKT